MSEPRTFGTLPEHPLCAFMVAMMVCLYLYAFPCSVIYNIVLQATDAYNFYTTGQNKIQQGFLKDGYELISEALNLLNNVYGAMHPEIAQCLRMLARLNYIMGEHAEAMAYQQKAVLMSERVNGIDHPYTITEYVSNN
jgi:protein TIF31